MKSTGMYNSFALPTTYEQLD